jgi:hypothetical protein
VQEKIDMSDESDSLNMIIKFHLKIRVSLFYFIYLLFFFFFEISMMFSIRKLCADLKELLDCAN